MRNGGLHNLKRLACHRAKTLTILLTALLIVLTFGIFPAYAKESGKEDAPRVIDQAELFTSSQKSRLEEAVEEAREQTRMDVVLVTTADAEGKESQAYADDFYDYGGYGVGKAKTGVLFLIDMDNRNLCISTGGDIIRILTDQRIEAMLESAFARATQSDYFGAAEAFVDDTVTYVKKGIVPGQYNYDTETGRISRYKSIRWYEALFAFGAAALAAAASCLTVINQYGMKKQRKQAAGYSLAYRADCRFAFHRNEDHLLNRFVTQARVPRSSGGSKGSGGSSGRSSTHTSSSGRTHGGGSRHF